MKTPARTDRQHAWPPGVPVSAAPVPALFSLVSLQHVDLIVSIVLTVAAIAIIAALAVSFWRELSNDTITIAPIAVPRELAERGYAPTAGR